MAQEERVDAGDRGRDEGVGGEGDGPSTLVDSERPHTGGGGTCPTRVEECAAPNEPNSCDDVCTTQHQYVIEVATNSGGVSGVDGCQANPISLVTKPIPAGGAEGGGVGGSTKPEARPRTERERRDAWMEIARREWIRSRAEKEARERERLARLNGGVASGGESAGGASGEVAGSQDVRGP